MRLVPRQLQRSGMTGSVPYYGGRLTPAQAYAASHPTSNVAMTPRLLPMPPAAPPAATAAAPQSAQSLAALQHLRDAGVLTDEELRMLAARVRP